MTIQFKNHTIYPLNSTTFLIFGTASFYLLAFLERRQSSARIDHVRVCPSRVPRMVWTALTLSWYEISVILRLPLSPTAFRCPGSEPADRTIPLAERQKSPDQRCRGYLYQVHASGVTCGWIGTTVSRQIIGICRVLATWYLSNNTGWFPHCMPLTRWFLNVT